MSLRLSWVWSALLVGYYPVMASLYWKFSSHVLFRSAIVYLVLLEKPVQNTRGLLIIFFFVNIFYDFYVVIHLAWLLLVYGASIGVSRRALVEFLQSDLLSPRKVSLVLQISFRLDASVKLLGFHRSFCEFVEESLLFGVFKCHIHQLVIDEPLQSSMQWLLVKMIR